MCIHPYPVLLSPVSCKVIHRDFHALALFEFAQGVCQQIKVKGIWVVKVIVVTGSHRLLLWGQDLRIAMILKLEYLTTACCFSMLQDFLRKWHEHILIFAYQKKISFSSNITHVFCSKINDAFTNNNAKTLWHRSLIESREVWGPKFRRTSCATVTSVRGGMCTHVSVLWVVEH